MNIKVSSERCMLVHQWNMCHMICLCFLSTIVFFFFFFFFQAEDGIRDKLVTGVQTCALPISRNLTDIPFVAAEWGDDRPFHGMSAIAGEGVHSEIFSRNGALFKAISIRRRRSEEHTSELQSLAYFVCRLLLDK